MFNNDFTACEITCDYMTWISTHCPFKEFCTAVDTEVYKVVECFVGLSDESVIVFISMAIDLQ